jgi:holo-ACP synthase CitX
VYRKDLLALLRGKDGRDTLRRGLLRGPEDCVVQMALNIPGLPKTLPGDRETIERTWLHWKGSFYFSSPRIVAWVKNAAGVALLLMFSGEAPRSLKKAGGRCEEELPWGRLLDIDVYTSRGPLSRALLGERPRRCFLCEGEAKACARAGTHSLISLRDAAVALMGRAEGGNARGKAPPKSPI